MKATPADTGLAASTLVPESAVPASVGAFVGAGVGDGPEALTMSEDGSGDGPEAPLLDGAGPGAGPEGVGDGPADSLVKVPGAAAKVLVPT